LPRRAVFYKFKKVIIMRILIIGAGNSGRHLASKLSDMSHEVVVVDRDSEPLAVLDAQLDILTVTGSGSSPETLEKAEIAKADLLIAVTDSDEVNIMACHCAKSAGVKNTVARVVNPALLASPLMNYEKLGVDCLVSQNEAAVEDMFDILSNPGLLESLDLFDGRVLVARIQVRKESPLLGGPISSLCHGNADSILAKIRFVVGRRGEKAFIPHGDTVLSEMDDLYVALLPEDLRSFLDWAYPGRRAFDKCVIAGGGGLGLTLVRRLESESVPAVLVERNAERAGECSEVLSKTLVLHGDTSDKDLLVNAGVGHDTAFAAMTGDEELNIISCMLAHKLGAEFTVALVSKPEYVPIIRSLGLLSRVISPHMSMINSILHFVRGKYIRAALCLHNAPGELLQVVVAEKHKWSGMLVGDLKMPGDCMIVSVLRGETVLIPTGKLTLEEGDQLIIFALPDDVSTVQRLFRERWRRRQAVGRGPLEAADAEASL